MKTTESMIPLIEKALGFKLYDWQRAYLLGESYAEPTERRSGRTTVYVIKLLLTNREPINIKFDAMKYKDHRGVHYTDFFRKFMREIDEKLTDVGLTTRSVKPKQNRGITIEVAVDIDKLQLKLRAIARHTEALADELDRIDNSEPCDRCGCIETETHSLCSYETTYETKYCSECGLKISEAELPNRLEGSD